MLEMLMTVVIAIVAVVLGVFAAYEFLFFIISVGCRLLRPTKRVLAKPQTKFGIIIPAHNEELLVGGLIDSIRRSNYPSSLCEIMVIADNCNDRTAEIARARGALAFERADVVNRGKPYALQWLLQQIDLNAFDAFVIIDADTVVDRDFLTVMNTSLLDGEKVIQGYFGVMNPDENWLTRLSILPGILKFKLHHPAKHLFGLSCPLAGNGMCFAAEVFRRYGWNAFSIAENWEYYIMLTLDGWVVTSAEDAVIYSQVARSLKTGKNQRMRWMKGRIGTLRQYGPRLLRGVFTRGAAVKLDALIELARPSHSMLFLWSLVFSIACAGLWAIGWIGAGGAIVAGTILGAQIVYFLSGLVMQRAPLRTWLALIMVPPYLVWKLSVSAAALAGLKDRRWVKTERH